MDNKFKKANLRALAIGAGVCNLMGCFFSGYLFAYALDEYHLAMTTCGAIFLFIRFFEVVIDFVVGGVFDKRGRTFLFSLKLIEYAILVASISMILIFTKLKITGMVQIFYFVFLLLALYSFFSIAEVGLWMLPLLMTKEADDRDSAYVWMGVSGNIGMGLGVVLIPAVMNRYAYRGQTTQAYTVLAVVIALLVVSGYHYMVGQLVDEKHVERESISLRKGIHMIACNRACRSVLSTVFFSATAIYLHLVVQRYYGLYTLENPMAGSILDGLLCLGMILGGLLVTVIIRRDGRKEMTIYMYAFLIFLGVFFYMCGYRSEPYVYCYCLVSAIGMGASGSLLNVMTSEAVDYGEYEYNQRNEGLIMGGRLMANKLGTMLAYAIAILFMNRMDLQSSLEQNFYVRRAFHACYTLYPSCFFLLAMICIMFSPMQLTRRKEILEILKKRAKEKEQKKS